MLISAVLTADANATVSASAAYLNFPAAGSVGSPVSLSSCLLMSYSFFFIPD